jgi:hypothetical protein
MPCLRHSLGKQEVMSIATPSTPNATRTPAKTGRHHQRLEKLGDIERQRRSLLVGLSAVAMVVLLAGSLAIADFYFEIVTLGRLGLWLAVIAAVVLAVWKMQPWLRFQSTDAVDAAERAWPEVGQRLRTSHDYSVTPEQVTPANPQLLAALEQETEQRVIEHEIPPLGRSWPIYSILCGCAIFAVVWVATLIAVPDWRVASARLLLMPMHYSSVTVDPIPEFLDQGDDLAVRIHVDGRPIDFAQLRYRPTASDEWTDVALTSESGSSSEDASADLAAVIRDRQEDFEVQIDAPPHVGAIHRVKVRVPLILDEWIATVQPPAYTGLPSKEGPPEGLRVPEGSILRLAARYNRAPDQVRVEIQSAGDTGVDDREPVETQVDQSQASFEILAAGSGMDFTVHATAADGMVDQSVLHIDVVADQRPRLKFVAPEEQAEAIPTAEMRFTLQAFDDYGLSNVGIRYRIDNGEEQTLWESALDDEVPALADSITLALEDLELQYPQAITYYAYAIDNRVNPGSEVTSELRFVDIRPFSREYEFKESNCNCQGECLTLEKLIKQQRDILGRTFVAARRSKVPGAVPVKLAKDQEDVRTKTESLRLALEEKIGPLPSLGFAAESMSAAIDDLNDQRIAEGQADEEQALAELIAARMNLRKILKQNNSQSQMCRNVDQQQMDKIRKPEPKDQQEKAKEEQLAEIRRELEKLAKQQQSFCQSAQACSKPGSSAGSKQSSQSQASSSQSASSAAPESSPSPSREELSEQQRQAAAATREIENQLAAGEFGELAPRRAGQAAESIGLSGEKLASGEADQQAIDAARDAAEQLARLSEHLGRRHQPDFSDKLDSARREAERLSQEQDDLVGSLASKGQPASDQPAESAQMRQQKLTSGGEELADLVDQLQADALAQDWQIQQQLIERDATGLTRDAAASMKAAEKQLQQHEVASASRSGARAARTLSQFADAIRQVQQVLGPAQLDQLIKAEQQAARLIRDLERASNRSEQALTQAESDQLAESIRPLANRDAELAAATDALASASPGGVRRRAASEVRDPTEQARLGVAPITLDESLRRVDQILQRRIQEAILNGAFQQTDGNVPPEYVDMVEEYYRTLSEDIE